MRTFAAAEAIIGSMSRGDYDALSDRDMLIVDDDTKLLNHRRIMLEADGWSTACYTFRKLENLSSRGALFVQHLKTEANILRDTGRRLRNTLDGFLSKISYYEDRVENAKLARLAAVRPNTSTGALWAADILYVATRNFGVLYLAQTKNYIFSYSRVLETLAEGGVISPAAIPDLLKLRLAKSFYRSGEDIPIGVAADIVQRALEARPDVSFPNRSRALRPIDVLTGSGELPRSSPAYHRLRNLERAYLALQAVDPALVVSENLSRLRRWIENPRAYSFLAAKSERNLITEMHYAGMR